MSLSLLYIPCPNLEVAETLARPLIESRKAVCANIIPEMRSIYLWDEKVQTDHECILILKVPSESSSTLVEELERNHPYETPCILEIKSDLTNPAYLQFAHSILGHK